MSEREAEENGRDVIRGPRLTLLVLGLAVLMGAFVVGAFVHGRRQIDIEVAEKAERIEQLRASHMAEDYRMMHAELRAITQDARLRSAMLVKDRQVLLQLSEPLFRRLRTGVEITHLYYTDVERVNVLRVHKPDTYGDVIDRHTTLEAERTRKPAQGVEVGPLGTFTMRVVYPWFDGDRLIGYLELGHEMNHLIELLGGILDLELRVLLRKEYLEREGWEAGMRMLGREGEWDHFPDVVMTSGEWSGLPPDVLAPLVEHGLDDTPEHLEREAGDRTYRVVFLPLEDAAGRDMGRFVVVVDITDRLAAALRFVLSVSLMSLIGFGFSMSLLFAYLVRLRKGIALIR